MPEQTQISAFISEETKREFERLVEKRGLKKAFVLEQALQFHLRALRELPAEFLVPPRLTLTAGSFDRVVDRIKSPRKPTAAMLALSGRSKR